MFLVIGGLLVISGMVLNSLLSGDAEAQEDVKNARFGVVVCDALFVTDGSKMKGSFGMGSDGSSATLEIYGDEETRVAFLGNNPKVNNEMMFYLTSKSKTDKRSVSMSIDQDGGRFDSNNKMGENVAFLGVGNKGGGVVDLRDKFGYIKKRLQ